MSPSAPRRPSAWAAVGTRLVHHARPVAVAVLVASGLAAGLAAWKLRVRPGYVDLLDASSPLQRRYLDLLRELGNVEPLYVVVDADDDAVASRFVDAFAPRARGLAGPDGAALVTGVVDRVDLAPLEDRAAAWLPSATLDDLASSPGVAELVADPSADRILATMRAMVAAQARRAMIGAQARRASEREPGAPAAGAPGPETLASALDALARVASGAIPPDPSALAAMASLPGRGLDAAGHLQVAPGRLLVTVMPADASNDYRIMEHLVSGVRRASDEARAAAGGPVRVALTGAPALIVDEMRAVRRDIALGSALSFALVTLLFFVSFNSLRHVVFAAVANACGLALTFGAAYLLVGHLNLFSSVFAAVLAGLGIDFGIHFINFYEARRRDGAEVESALVDAFASVFPPISLSAVTTAAAFFTVMTSSFAGFAQLGLISGVGVLLCLLTAFTLVPSLLAWNLGRGPRPARPSRSPWSVPLLELPVRHAAVVAPACAVVIVLAATSAARLRFDHDLMNLQPSGTEAVSLQRAGSRRIDTHPAFSLASDVEQARARAAAFRALPSVASVHSPADALPRTDPDRAAALGRLDAALAREPTAPPPADAGTAREQALGLEADLVALQDLAFEGGSAQDVTALDGVIASTRSLVAALETPGAEQRLDALRASLAPRLRRMRALLPELAASGVGPRDLPEGLRALVGAGGRIAVAVIPKQSVWDREQLVRFLDEIRTVDPDVTGPAVQVGEITELMRVSLRRAAWIALAVIATLVLASTRSLATTGLSLLPLGAGFVLMLGSMRWLGVPLNPANLVALPLLLGIGVDGGVHLVHRWRETRDAARAVADVGHALLITSLTTVAGFLPLLMARHRGIRSLGQATCLGSLGMLAAVVVVGPSFLAILDRARARRRDRRGSAP